MKKFSVILLLLMVWPWHPSYAAKKDVIPGPVIAYVVSVYDGDTFTADAHVWPGHYINTGVRVLGVDTPEIKGKCPEEVALAQRARAYVSNLLAKSEIVELRNIQTDKYGGRVEADVYVDDKNLAELLIEAGLGRPYEGAKRQTWCEGS